MRRVRIGLLGGLLTAGIVVAGEPVLPVAGEDARVQAVLSRRYIPVEGAGAVAVRYEDALATFGRADLLDEVQAEYVRMLKPGEEPEFVVQCTGPGAYAYENAHGQRSEIHELHRGASGTNRFEVVYHVAGERFFGQFQSLIHVGIVPSGSDRTAYDVRVYAYPESALPRFFARHLGLVERYFKHKTRDMESMAARIVTRLCQPEGVAQVAVR